MAEMIISYPKAGRTLLRVIIAEILKQHTGKLNEIFCTHISRGTGIDNLHRQPHQWSQFNTYYNNKIICLNRDARDIVVSLYFHVLKRDKTNLDMSLSEFIRHPVWGIRDIKNFYDNLLYLRDKFSDFLHIQYKDLVNDKLTQIKRIYRFLRVLPKDIDRVIQVSSFQHMKNIEKQDRESELLLGRGVLKQIDKQDNDSCKVRRGVIGGYKDYLTEEDIKYCEKVLDY